MFSFEVVNSVHLSNFFMKYFWLRGYIRLPQKGPTQFYKLFFLGGGDRKKFQAGLECVRSYASSFGHSDPDPSSVSVLVVVLDGSGGV